MFKYVKFKKDVNIDLKAEADKLYPDRGIAVAKFSKNARPLSIDILLGARHCPLVRFYDDRPTDKYDEVLNVFSKKDGKTQVFVIFKKNGETYGIYESTDIDLGDYKPYFDDPEEIIFQEEYDTMDFFDKEAKLLDHLNQKFSKILIENGTIPSRYSDKYFEDEQYTDWIGYSILEDRVRACILCNRLFLNLGVRSDYFEVNEEAYSDKCNLSLGFNNGSSTVVFPRGLNDPFDVTPKGELKIQYSNGCILLDSRAPIKDQIRWVTNEQ